MNRTLRLSALALGSMMVFAGVGGGPVACSSHNNGLLPLDGQGGNAGASGTGGTTSTDGFGEACTSDKQCKEYNLLCDSDLGCVECVAATDCPAPSQGEAACSAGKCGALIPCENSLDCPDDLVCDTAAGTCAECVGDGDCTGDQVCVQGSCSAAPECITSDECGADQQCIDSACVTVTACTTTDDCTGGQVCDVDGGTCVECLTSGDCDTGETCTANQCVTSSGTCDKPRVIVLMQRSGGMFDPSTIAPDGWWAPLSSALTDSGGLIEQFSDELDIGVSLFYSLKEANTCPLVDKETLPANPSDVKTLMDNAASAYAASVVDKVKVDAPVPEAITATANLLKDNGNPPFIVLVTTSIPDTCTQQDTPCNTDAVVANVQAAKAAGITTYVLGLKDDQFQFQPYLLQAVANAGVGQPVESLPIGTDSTSCAITEAGTYAETGGNATAYIAEATTDVKTGLESIFNKIAASCN